MNDAKKTFLAAGLMGAWRFINSLRGGDETTAKKSVVEMTDALSGFVEEVEKEEANEKITGRG